MTDFILAELTVGNSKAKSALEETAADFAKLGGVVEKNTLRLAGVSREFAALARSAGVYVDGSDRMARATDQANRALERGKISLEQHARIMETARARYDDTTAAVAREAKAIEAATAAKVAAWDAEVREREANASMIIAFEKAQADAARKAAEEEAAVVEAKIAAWDSAAREREADAAMIIAAEKAEAAVAAQAAAENERLAATYESVRASIDPAFAAQKKFDAALADLRAGAAAAGVSVGQLAADEAALTATMGPAAVAARKLAGEYQDLLGKYDPVRAAVREHGQEVARVTAILDKVNASEEERATVLKAVADAYDPATRAANERAAALKKEAEAQAALMASYREQAALARSGAAGQQSWNTYAGVMTTPVKSAADSASVFVQNQEETAAVNRAAEARARRRQAVEDETRAIEHQLKVDTAAALRREAAALEALELRLDKSGAAARRAADDQRTLDKALADARMTPERHAQLTRALREQAGATDGVARSTKLAAHEWSNLSYQVQDFIVQVGSGQGIFRPLLQQTPQAVGAVGGVGRAVALLATPAGMAATAVLAVAASVGAVVAAQAGYASSIREMTNANRSMGNGLGVTTAGLEALAASSAAAGNVSAKAARTMVAEYNLVGRIGPDVIQSLIGITRDFAAVTGQELPAATKELAGLVKDPAKGAEELAGKFGLLSGEMLEYVQRLQESGRTVEAQRLVVGALGQRIKGAAEETSVWSRAWDFVARSASDAFDAMGKAADRAVNGPSLENRLAGAEAALARLRAIREEEERLGQPDKSWRPGQSIGEAALSPLPPSTAADDMQMEVEALRDLARERNRFAAVQAIAANNNANGRAAVEVAQRYDELGASLRRAEADLVKLQAGLGPNMGAAAEKGAKTVEALTLQIADLSRVRASGLDLQTFKARELAQIEQQAAGMIGQARERFLATERTRIELIGTATSATRREAQVQTALGQVIANQSQAVTEAGSTSAVPEDLANGDEVFAIFKEAFR